jgi:hypothetical protein
MAESHQAMALLERAQRHPTPLRSTGMTARTVSRNELPAAPPGEGREPKMTAGSGAGTLRVPQHPDGRLELPSEHPG